MSESRKERRLRKLRSAFAIAILPWVEEVEGDTEKEKVYARGHLDGLLKGEEIAKYVIVAEE